jgi:glycosyltransferase involved in cell wall biosynthesis
MDLRDGILARAFRALWVSPIRRVTKRLIPRRYHPSIAMAAKPMLNLHSCDLDFFEAVLSERRQLEPVAGRIILVCSSLAPGGAERQVVNTLTGLVRAGWKDVHLLCDYLDPLQPQQYDFYLPQAIETGATVRVIESQFRRQEPMNGLPAGLAGKFKSMHPRLAIDIANLYWEFRKLRPSVVHAWLDWSNIRAGVAAVLAGVPRVILSGRNIAPHNFPLYEPFMDPGYKALCALPDVYFVNNSRAGAENYAAWLGIDPQDIEVIYNGVDFDGIERPDDTERAVTRQRFGVPPGSLLVGGMFRFNQEKQPLLWLKVAAIIAAQRADVHFILFGDGDLRPQMEAAAADLGLSGRLQMPGLVSPGSAAISSMDLMLMTSLAEGTPNVALEAQWLGVPVVTTDAGGASEAIALGRTGLVVGTHDAREIAQCVLATLADTEFNRSVRTSGPEFISQRFSLDRMISQTLDAYGFEARKPLAAL